jgi:hypothetical protein
MFAIVSLGAGRCWMIHGCQVFDGQIGKQNCEVSTTLSCPRRILQLFAQGNFDRSDP